MEPLSAQPPLELAVVVPTFNEHDNVPLLLDKLEHALAGVRYEVIFVDDDSSDGTADAVRAIGASNPAVRVVQRINRRGLSSACIEGMMSTAAPYIAVMDADLQHDERILPQMLDKLKAESLDLVIATRNAEGGGMGEFARSRVMLSNLGDRLSRFISHASLSDPMSGFFVVRRAYVEEVVRSTSAIGFKILLDLVASSTRPVRIAPHPHRPGSAVLSPVPRRTRSPVVLLRSRYALVTGGMRPPCIHKAWMSHPCRWSSMKAAPTSLGSSRTAGRGRRNPDRAAGRVSSAGTRSGRRPARGRRGLGLDDGRLVGLPAQGQHDQAPEHQRDREHDRRRQETAAADILQESADGGTDEASEVA